MALASMAASLTLIAGFGQTPAELLQKGIYTQETAGDLDGAIQIYRQVVGLASNQPAIAAQAQFRLTGSLLQKGDLGGAGPEFETLARKYPGQESLVDEMGQRLRTIAANGPAQLLGNFQNGRYHHYWTGVDLTEPAGWTFKNLKAQPDGFDRIDLADRGGKATQAMVVVRRQAASGSSPGPVYLIAGPDGLGGPGALTVRRVERAASPAPEASPASMADQLQNRMKMKIANQRQEGDGYHGYAYRANSVQSRTVGGQQALSAIGDYKDGKGVAMSEYLTWVETPKTRAFFSLQAPAQDFQDLMPRFEPVISTAVIP
jgi:hypothetical protein